MFPERNNFRGMPILPGSRREAIVEAAKRWLGTPYHHQGRLLGVGCDCLGLITEIGKELGLLDYDSASYSAMPDGRTMEAECRRNLVGPKALPQPGDIALMWIQQRNLPQHLAIFVPWDQRIGIIHAHQRFDDVKQHSFDGFWRKRLADIYSYPGVE